MSDYSEQFLSDGRDDEAVRAEIPVPVTDAAADAPSVRKCRYAALPLGIQADDRRCGCVIYDRILNRIVDEVYYMPLGDVLRITAALAALGEPHTGPALNGDAVGLVHPAPTKTTRAK